MAGCPLVPLTIDAADDLSVSLCSVTDYLGVTKREVGWQKTVDRSTCCKTARPTFDFNGPCPCSGYVAELCSAVSLISFLLHAETDRCSVPLSSSTVSVTCLQQDLGGQSALVLRSSLCSLLTASSMVVVKVNRQDPRPYVCLASCSRLWVWVLATVCPHQLMVVGLFWFPGLAFGDSQHLVGGWARHSDDIQVVGWEGKTF